MTMNRQQTQHGDGTSAPEADLADLMRAFSDVTMRLEATHEGLRGEVSRLRAELGEANARLERSKRLAALGEMAAGIAHEVRNPLGSIGLYARMLEQDLAERPSLREMAGRIRRSVIGLDAIVNDVLDFSRDLRIEATACDAWELLDRALETCCPGGTTPSGVSVRRVGEMGSSLIAKCDGGLMHQALVNVIRNALESMAETTCAARVLTLGVERRAGGDGSGGEHSMIVLIVRDSGGGIAPEVRDRMFNPFFTTRRAGTGLGLAIVHRIIDAHDGGAVNVSNVRDEDGHVGAQVELIVPAEPQVATLHDAMRIETGDAMDSTHNEPLALHAGFVQRRYVA